MQRLFSVQLTRLGTLLITLVLSGCMVGPDFRSPPIPKLRHYFPSRLPKQTMRTPLAKKGGRAQVFVYNKDLAADWWRLFQSKELNKLIETGLNNSPNITAAMATLRQAQENVNVQVGTLLFPNFNGNFTGQRQKFSSSIFGGGAGGSGTIFNLFNASISVSYLLDIFGGSRRQIEGLIAQADYQQFQLMAAYISLTSNIATTAITMASLSAQIKATKELIRFGDKQLNILRKQFELGGISLASVLTQETFVEQTRATLPPLEQGLAVATHQLATLIGVYPNARLPLLDLDRITLPKYIPVSLPSNLVRQRPDIRAAEATLHAASAQVGVATANMFPQISITGAYGFQSLVASSLFQKQNIIWNIAGKVTQPLFQGGALLAARRAAIAGFDAALAQYRQAVLLGFQNVADSLKAIQHDARTLNALKKAENAAYKSLSLTNKQFYLGGTTYLALLIAQQQFQQARINRIRSQAARYTNTVALYQSLGGGWWHYPCAPSLNVDGWSC